MDLSKIDSPLESAASGISEPAELAAAFAAIPAEEIAPEALGAAPGADPGTPGTPGAPGAAAPPGVMPKDEWCKLWLACHGMTGNIMGSAVLAKAAERPGGMDAAGAIYDIAAETPALRWMIDGGNVWFKRAACLAVFYVPLGAEIRRERAARVPPPLRVSGVSGVSGVPANDSPPVPANDNQAEAAGLAMPPGGAQ